MSDTATWQPTCMYQLDFSIAVDLTGNLGGECGGMAVEKLVVMARNSTTPSCENRRE